MDIDALFRFPNSPISVYWAGRNLLNRLASLPRLDPDYTETAQGQATGDDFRFLRAIWETPILEGIKWKPFAKGGDYSRYFSDLHLAIDWSTAAIDEYKKLTIRSVLISKRQQKFRGRKVLVWSRVNQQGFNVRALPDGALFADKAPAIFADEHADWLLGYLSSGLIDQICELQNPNRMFEVRDVNNLPIAISNDQKQLATLARAIYHYKAFWSARREPNANYLAPLLIAGGIHHSVQNSWVHTCQQISSVRQKLMEYYNSVDQAVEKALMLTDITSERTKLKRSQQAEDPLFPDGFHEKHIEALEDVIKEQFLYMLGCIYGRWDIYKVTGKQQISERFEPFAPLPLCSHGMLQNIHGLPATPDDVPVDYPLGICWPGILVNEPGHPEDIEQRVREVLHVIWPDRADAIEQEACEILGMGSLRAYFANPNHFFDDHLKRYSKGRRAAPIYWPLSTPSGSYTLWLYYHRLTDQTIYSCVNDFVEPKLAQVSSQAAELQRRSNRSRQEEKALEQVSELALELGAFRDELLRIARFWQPNLNDGVQITAAPLWQLFQHRPWQKRLKETWSALEAGDYDWAHLAYSIWPDRVRAKCKTDKSLAIAHDLEHLYVEPAKPVKAKKGGKSKPQAEAEQGELL